MYTREATKYSQKLKDGKPCGPVFMDKIELIDYNYKDFRLIDDNIELILSPFYRDSVGMEELRGK